MTFTKFAATPTPSDIVQDEQVWQAFHDASADSTQLYRVRFFSRWDPKFPGDTRPAVWPIKWPCWCSGQSLDDGPDGHFVMIAVANSWEYIKVIYPEAYEVSLVSKLDTVEAAFSDRFPKPEWWPDETQ